MLKENQYQIWFMYGSIDLMKVVSDLEGSGNFFLHPNGGPKEIIFSPLVPPLDTKKNSPSPQDLRLLS